MATIKIYPIQVLSRGGFAVVIRGVRPFDHDCFVGSIVTVSGVETEAEWDLGGLMRGGTGDTNLNMREPEMAELAKLAEALGAT